MSAYRTEVAGLIVVLNDDDEANARQPQPSDAAWRALDTSTNVAIVTAGAGVEEVAAAVAVVPCAAACCVVQVLPGIALRGGEAG